MGCVIVEGRTGLGAVVTEYKPGHFACMSGSMGDSVRVWREGENWRGVMFNDGCEWKRHLIKADSKEDALDELIVEYTDETSAVFDGMILLKKQRDRSRAIYGAALLAWGALIGAFVFFWVWFHFFPGPGFMNRGH